MAVIFKSIKCKSLHCGIVEASKQTTLIEHFPKQKSQSDLQEKEEGTEGDERQRKNIMVTPEKTN